MAYNELFALAFVAPYVASEKKIPPTAVQEMMRRSLYHIKWYFAKTDLNTDKGKAENKKSVVKYAKWYTPEKEAKYPTSFKVDFVGQPYEGRYDRTYNGRVFKRRKASGRSAVYR